MKIHLLNGDAFVELHQNYLLRIGTEAEVRWAGAEEILDLICAAMAASITGPPKSQPAEIRH